MIAKHGSARGNRSIADGYADVDDVLVVSAENVDIVTVDAAAVLRPPSPTQPGIAVARVARSCPAGHLPPRRDPAASCQILLSASAEAGQMHQSDNLAPFYLNNTQGVKM